jgi:hypothetical protein
VTDWKYQGSNLLAVVYLQELYSIPKSLHKYLTLLNLVVDMVVTFLFRGIPLVRLIKVYESIKPLP